MKFVCLNQAFGKSDGKRPKSGIRGIFFYQDHAPAHTAARTVNYLTTWGAQMLPYLPYSPDFDPYGKIMLLEIKFSTADKADRQDNLNNVLKA